MTIRKIFGLQSNLLVTALILSTTISCTNQNTANSTDQHTQGDTVQAPKSIYETIAKMAGNYVVTTDDTKPGDNEEIYVLKPDATVKWMMVVNDGDGGAHVSEQKEGNWTATPTGISISLSEMAAEPTEEYVLKDTVFVEKKAGKRRITKYD